MSEWIGDFIAGWPLWAVIIVLLAVSVVWITFYLGSLDWPWEKKEWWQDRAKRLEKEEKAKMKQRKG